MNVKFINLHTKIVNCPSTLLEVNVEIEAQLHTFSISTLDSRPRHLAPAETAHLTHCL